METLMNLLRAGIWVLFAIYPFAQTEQSNQAEAKQAFEIADYYRTAFLGSPAVSPDGKYVAFTVRRYSLEKAKTWSEIWMMASDGSGLRQMTFAGHNDTNPTFSPDGKRLLFVSDREDPKPQLFLLSIDGGEPRKLTSFSMGVADPRWSPDSRWIAVTARVYPDCGFDNDCNRKISERMEEGSLQVRVADGLLYRHWDSWREGRYSHILLVDAENGSIVKDITPGLWDSPTFSLDADRGYDFSPDSRELCYVSNHDPDPASSTNADLWIVSIDGDVGENTAVNITAANHGWDGSPMYSPDGRCIAYRSQATPGYESDLFRLAVYDRRTESVRYLTDSVNYDNWVTNLTWTSDSESLFFQGEYQARNPIYRISIGTRKIQPVLTDGAITSWSPLPNEDALIYARHKVSEPPEIFRTSVRNGKPEQLTHFNSKLIAEVDIREAEEMWVQGAGDYKVHVFIIKPHGFDPSKRYPTILNVHGGPQSQWMDSYRGDWQVYPGKGYIVAFANPTGSTGYGQEFTAAISKDWGGRVFQDLMKVADALERLPYVDRDRMGAMGWSYGGYMMMWFEGNTARFKASASMMGIFDLTSMYGSTEELWFPEWDLGGTPWTSDLYIKWSPSQYAKNFKTPCLVITGEKDFRVPYTQSLEYFTALQKRHVPSKLVVYKKAGHWPNWYEMAFYYNMHLDWFHRWLGGEAAPYDVQKFMRNELFE
jgi:dipeptidyl aminopeptidase/acylaminoacyl peptidase